jgi:hypothetical protein
MSRRRIRLSLATAVVGLAALAVPAFALAPKTGVYNATCPQGFSQQCGEAAWVVSHAGKQIDKNSSVPWPNDPAQPSVGICNRGNPFVLKAIKVKKGKFSYTGKANNQTFTWTGKWTAKKKLKGTVKWAGCATLVHYTATWVR